jgi:uncharacterized membrane protein
VRAIARDLERPDHRSTGGLRMSTTPPPLTPQSPAAPIVSNAQLALIVYILYFASYFVGGATALVGVVIAHIQIEDSDPLLRTHYEWQIRTFWIGLLYLAVGLLLMIVIIGFAVLVFWFVWTLVRTIKGVLALNENKPIAKPKSWMFG